MRGPILKHGLLVSGCGLLTEKLLIFTKNKSNTVFFFHIPPCSQQGLSCALSWAALDGSVCGTGYPRTVGKVVQHPLGPSLSRGFLSGAQMNLNQAREIAEQFKATPEFPFHVLQLTNNGKLPTCKGS